MPYFIGIDIGGTNIEIGILNKKGKILIKSTIKTNSFEGIEKTFSRIWKEIQTLAREIKISQSKIVSIGIGIPGIVTNDSIVKIAANFPWGKNFNAKEIMEKISNKPVKIGNDVKLIALGELLFGRAKGYANSIIIPIGTGIAAGIISNGNLLKGHGGSAGEIGHVVIDENGYPCGCGLKGCLETYCSSKGILREAKKRLAKNQNNLLYKKIEGNLDNLEVKDIFDLASKGDKFSLKIVDFFVIT